MFQILQNIDRDVVVNVQIDSEIESKSLFYFNLEMTIILYVILTKLPFSLKVIF